MGYYRIDPTRGFETLIKQIQNVAEEFNKGVNIETSAFKPRIDITENNDSFSVYAELPGIDKQNVSISVNEDRVLNIKGSKSNDLPEGRSVLRSERKFGEFSRSLQLPEEADIEKINATFNNGVLELSISKKEPEQPKVIEVKLS
jgi:HSP20 family protein